MNVDWAGIGGTGWLVFAVTAAAVLYPTGRILARMGFTPILSVILLVPLVNLLVLWILAFVEWPNQPMTGTPSYNNRAAIATSALLRCAKQRPRAQRRSQVSYARFASCRRIARSSRRRAASTLG